MVLAAWGYAALGAVSFTDQNLDAGYLNPGDVGIAIQQIVVQGDSTKQAYFDAITVRNLGTATHEEIVKIEIWNGGVKLGEITDPIGLATGGVTIPVNYTLAAGATATLEVRVDVAGTASVAGGETLILEVRFHYFLGATAYTSAWIADGKTEEIKRAGFEEIEETTLAAGNYNPGDGAGSPVQQVTFTDTDANSAQIEVTTIKVRNLGTATDADIEKLVVKVTDNGTTYTADTAAIPGIDLSTWNDGGVEFVPNNFVNGGGQWNGIVDDDAAIEILVEIKVKDPLASDGRTVRTEVIIELSEQQPGGDQNFVQSSQAPTTQTIRNAGVEEIEEQSTPPASGVLNPGELLIQKIRLTDFDVNNNVPEVTCVWVKNLGTANGGQNEDIVEIRVRTGAGTPLGTFNNAEIEDLRTTGVWLDITDQALSDDDGELVIEILFRIGDNLTPGATLRPRIMVKINEDLVNNNQDETNSAYESAAVDYPQFVELRDPGFEYAEDIAQDSATVYTGQRFCAQKIRLDDQDENDDGVTINPVVIKNLGTATGTDGGTEVVKIEIRNANGDLLGETEDTSGLTASGVTISTLQNNTVADNGATELWIWVTIAAPEEAEADRTVKLETTVFHLEDGATYQATVTSEAMFTIAINHRPVVDFNWSPTDPTWEDTITFTPQNVSDPDGDALVEYRWDFGDGSDPVVKTGAQSVTHEYPEGGTFTVTLTVTDERGLTGTKSKEITVEGRLNQPPTADFDWTPTSPEAGDEVTFTATASDPDDPPDTPLTYAWDFGDGTTLAASEDNQEVTHTYANAGTYTVTLTVSDSRGAQTVVEHDITVVEAVNAPPTITQFSASTNTPAVNQEVTFTATAADDENDEITDWEWDFGDGTTSTAAPPVTHTYTKTGFITVKVRAKDGNGSNTFGPWASLEIYVRGPGAADIGTKLAQNPVATQAAIEFLLPQGAENPVLRVFDLLGRLVFQSDAPVDGQFTWGLVDSADRAVPNGLYFYLITATLDGRTIRSEVGRILVVR